MHNCVPCEHDLDKKCAINNGRIQLPFFVGWLLCLLRARVHVNTVLRSCAGNERPPLPLLHAHAHTHTHVPRPLQAYTHTPPPSLSLCTHTRTHHLPPSPSARTRARTHLLRRGLFFFVNNHNRPILNQIFRRCTCTFRRRTFDMSGFNSPAAAIREEDTLRSPPPVLRRNAVARMGNASTFVAPGAAGSPGAAGAPGAAGSPCSPCSPTPMSYRRGPWRGRGLFAVASPGSSAPTPMMQEDRSGRTLTAMQRAQRRKRCQQKFEQFRNAEGAADATAAAPAKRKHAGVNDGSAAPPTKANTKSRARNPAGGRSLFQDEGAGNDDGDGQVNYFV